MAVVTPIDQAARRRILEDLDGTLFVEAGAGTGKTTALVGRIVRLVASGRTELRRIAAITFTEAAAAELRDRVRQKLEEAARGADDLPAEERQRCEAALGQVDGAAIQTLHSFAQRLLAEHPIEAGLPPLIEVLDDIRGSIAFDERWTAWLDELLDDPAYEALLRRALALGLKLEHLRELARQFQQHWDRLAGASFAATEPAEVDVARLVEALRAACGALSACQNETDQLYQHLLRTAAYAERLAGADGELDRLRLLVEGPRLRFSRGQAANWRGVRPADIRDQLAAAEEIRAGLVAAARASVLPPLLAAVRGFVLDYAEERRRQGRLEFHDLLVRARNLLHDQPAVREAARQQFSHLLIDEFQDTDPLQIEIAVLLAGREVQPGQPWHEVSVEPGRLFFVGDPKQSIYRFRRADIALYQRAQRRFAEGTLHLTQNFRSLWPLLEWVNHVFQALIGDGEPEAQAPYVPLQPARQPAAEQPQVHVLGGPQPGTTGDIRAREAAEIVQVIRTAKLAWQVEERGEDGQPRQRPACYADVAILLPTRTGLPAIEQALEEAGIPYRVESRSLVYSTQEVRDLLTILRAVDDPTDEVAVVAALRSPAFGCGDDDLLRYVRAGGRWDYRRVPAGLPETDPVRAAMAALKALHERRWWVGLSALVEAVIRERRLLELAFAHARPRDRWQRLRFIQDQARAFEEAGGASLRQFVDWAERQAEEGTAVVERVVPEPDDDAVRIMTVHASKGLEFPIVVLAGLNVDHGRAGAGRSVRVLWQANGQPEARLGSSESAFETAGFATLAEHEQTMEEHEQVRLLYVAATRARDHLVLSLQHQDGRSCHAARLYPLCVEAPHLWHEAPTEPPAAPAVEPEAVLFDDSAAQRQAWLAARQGRLARLGRAPVLAATAIARQVAGGEADPNLRKEAVEEEAPWRRGRAGTAIGRAVHAILQTIDLATGAGLAAAARAQATAEGIPDRVGEVERLARAALEAAVVREAVASGRFWREVYVAAPVEGVTVEGFIDLLYESPSGLVVVDYKTDVVPSEADLAAAMARYRLQGAAYALALQAALGQPVARCVFVFVGAGGAREVPVADLPAAMAEVRQVVSSLDSTAAPATLGRASRPASP